MIQLRHLVFILLPTLGSIAGAPAATRPGNGNETHVDASGRTACMTQCESIEVRCNRHARQAKQQCMHRPATGGVDPLTMRREMDAWFCGWFSDELNSDHCAGTHDPQRCAERYAARHTRCTETYNDNTTRQYLSCKDNERQSLALCRDELGDCRAACGE